MNNIAVLPLRAGSQRIINKNIKLVDGKPLLYYQINCALNTPEIDKLVVITDSLEYSDLAKTLGAEVIIRPAEISGPDSKSEASLIYVINELKKKGETYENIILLQATSPFNKPEYIKEGIKLLELEKSNSLVMDFSNGKKIALSKKKYYELGGIPVKGYKVHSYTGKEAANKMVKLGHWGPWDSNAPR